MTATIMERKLTDSQIHNKVIEELRWDSRVRETDVGVEVDRGVVTLTGTVGSYAEKLAALEAAYRVAGVVDVANDIVVRTATDMPVSDTDIAHAVRRALEWDTFVPSQLIRSNVTDGWVTLEGTVPLFRQRLDAERAIQNLFGVKGVVNRIVASTAAASEAVVQKTIETVLERQAEREARHLAVSVVDGTVRLEGKVRTHSERKAVLEAVAHAPNVRMVEDQLVVDPDL